MAEALEKYVADKGLEMEDIVEWTVNQLQMFLLLYSDEKGRSEYGDGLVGISPKTAKSYANTLFRLLEKRGLGKVIYVN